MVKGKYIGPDPKLIGQTALLQSGGEPDEVKAQFDSWHLGLDLTHNWVTYPLEFWEIDSETNLFGEIGPITETYFEEGQEEYFEEDMEPKPEEPLRFDQ